MCFGSIDHQIFVRHIGAIMVNIALVLMFVLIPFLGPIVGYYTYSSKMTVSEDRYILYWTISSLIVGVAAGLKILWTASC
jgi:hypothetical protein